MHDRPVGGHCTLRVFSAIRSQTLVVYLLEVGFRLAMTF
jgi:hypothetical protein